MSAGMAGVIAAHPERKYGVFTEGGWWIGCTECDWRRPIGDSPIDTNTAPLHTAHVAEELAKAGYGNVQEALLSAADEMEQERSTWCLDDSGRHWIRRTLNELRERAHGLDPEGHALVKAIHDRKAEGALGVRR